MQDCKGKTKEQKGLHALHIYLDLDRNLLRRSFAQCAERVECHGWQLMENTGVSGVFHCISWQLLCLGNPAQWQQPTMKCAHAPQSHNMSNAWVFTLCICDWASVCVYVQKLIRVYVRVLYATVAKGLLHADACIRVCTNVRWRHPCVSECPQVCDYTGTVYPFSGVSCSLMLHMHNALPWY